MSQEEQSAETYHDGRRTNARSASDPTNNTTHQVRAATSVDGKATAAHIALIDPLALRRAGTIGLLSDFLEHRVQPYEAADIFVAQLGSGASRPCAVILTVGATPVAQMPAIAQLSCMREAAPDLPIIVLSDLDDAEQAMATLRAGAHGHIPTSLEPHLVIQAIRMVLAGGMFVPPNALLHWPVTARSDLHPSPPSPLPPRSSEMWPTRQLAVLQLLAHGKPNKEIAIALRMDESTVKSHVGLIMRRLGAANRTQAALYARRLEHISAAS